MYQTCLFDIFLKPPGPDSVSAVDSACSLMCWRPGSVRCLPIDWSRNLWIFFFRNN